VVDCCECGDEPSGSCTMELVSYMLMPSCLKAGQKQSIKTVNRSSEDVAQLKYLRAILTDQNCMHKQIKIRINSGNASYHSVQSILSFRLLYKYVKVKIYKP
jgi:hypothetical protein